MDSSDTSPIRPAALQSLWTEVPDGVMHARTGANKPSPGTPIVVLVHGMNISSSYMVPTAVRLAPLCKVYAVDLPGYGRSYKPWPILDLPQLADALAIWMEALDLPKAHFAGNSFGCQILAEFAKRYPEWVDRLVFAGPTVDAAARTLWQQAFRMMRGSRLESASLRRLQVQAYRTMGLRRAWENIKLVLADRIEERLPLVQAPTLVVRGENDPIVPQRWAEEVARLLPHGELRVIQEGSHALNYSFPDQFVAVMKPFLRF